MGQGPAHLPKEELTRFKSILNKEDYADLIREHPSLKAWFWGANPGQDLSNQKKWLKIQPGDLVLFTQEGAFVAKAIVGTKFKSKRFSRTVFDDSMSPGTTWEYVYSLKNMKDIQALNWKYARVNKWLGYRIGNPFRRLTYLDDRRSQIIFSKLNLKLPTSPQPLNSPGQIAKLLGTIEGDLDAKTVSMRRREQTRLKKYLLNNSQFGGCLLCGKRFHKDALVAAHIKGRAKCTDEEKRNFRGIVMLNCKFGCDFLYGAGYISVSNQKKIALSPKLNASLGRSEALYLKGRRIAATPEQEPFFKWHREHDFKR